MKSSRLVASLATREGVRNESGCEAGALESSGGVRVPSPAREGLLEDAATEARVEGVSALARTLRGALGASPDLVSEGCQVRVVEARVRDEALEGPSAGEHTLLSAQAFVGPDAHRPRWTRLTLLAPGTGGWPAGFVPALERLVRSARAPALAAPEAFASCRDIVLDAFAFSDLLRVASRGWSRGRVGQSSGLPAAVEVDECDLLKGAGRPDGSSPLVRGGRLAATPESLGCWTRASWREHPRLDWRGLLARLPQHAEPALRPGVLLLTTLHVLPGALLAAGLLVDSEGQERSVAPMPLPGPGALLTALRGARGAGFPDASGLPVIAPPAHLDRDLVLRNLR